MITMMITMIIAADSVSIIERKGVGRENHNGGKILGGIKAKIIQM